MYMQLCTELSYALWWLVVHQFCGGRKVMCDQTSDSWFLFFMLLPHIVIFTCTVSIWRQTGLSVGWANRKMFEMLNVYVFSLFQGYSRLVTLCFCSHGLQFCASKAASLGAEGAGTALREHLWRVRGEPLGCQLWIVSPLSDQFFVSRKLCSCSAPLLWNQHTFPDASCFGRTNAYQPREWE